MKLITRFVTVGFAAATLLLAACSGTPVRLGTPSDQVDTANVDFSNGRKISASASGFQLLLWIPISVNDRQARAYQSLLNQAPGDYITDVKIDESWTYAFVGTIYKTTIEATAYPKK
jgi:hypothetical protein